MADNIATKYRPKTLDGYIGNKKLKADIGQMMGMPDEDLPKSFMFVGPSGCGKTTIARLIAKRYLGIQKDDKTFDEYIETGDTAEIENLMEIDVGQDRGIANMEAIKADMMVPSFDGGWKVYIFDEFHASSKVSQNALLKILEDTPDNVLMIFCTTNKSMIIPTILGRIQHIYTVTKPDNAELSSYLARICKEESWKFDPHGLQMISKLSGYQIRDALRNLAEVCDIYGDATQASVSQRFDVITDVYAQKFFMAYKNKDCVTGTNLLYRVKKSFDIESFYELLKEYILRGIYVRNGVPVEGYDTKELQSYKKLFKDFSMEDIAGLLMDLQDLNKYANSPLDLEIHLIAMTVKGIPKTVLKDEMTVRDTAEETCKEEPKSFVDTKKIEEATRKKNITEKKEAKKEQGKKRLEELLKTVSILDNLERFGGKVYLITNHFPD